jgi:hypothetical protein
MSDVVIDHVSEDEKLDERRHDKWVHYRLPWSR